MQVAMVYQIRLKGHQGHQWTDWFGGLTITLEEYLFNNLGGGECAGGFAAHTPPIFPYLLRRYLEDNGDTLLTGPVVDQAALYGLPRKVRDSGMPLLSVNCVKPGQSEALQQQPQGRRSQMSSKAKSGISSVGTLGTFLKVGT
jgi:hypothetical protein